MIKPALFVIACFFCQMASAQYYFQDIVTAGNTSKNFRLLKTNKVKKATVTSIEPDGNETENFGIVQLVDASKAQLTTVTTASVTGSSNLVTKFNTKDLPVKITDSSANTVNNVTYNYDDAGRLLLLSSESHEPDDTNHYFIREDHQFVYNANGQLVKMLKIKDKYDTVSVVFVPAENGLPGEEQWFKKNRKIETWFYYYDDKNNLTDIVRFNATAQKMLPDYVFEYNTSGQMTQQTVVQPGTNFYRLWLYDYDDKGLKKSETIFKKGKEQEGRIIYEYNF
ncbi:hypothetical protein BH10BAC3_BH10BAC3_29840 [soil metagenome]